MENPGLGAAVLRVGYNRNMKVLDAKIPKKDLLKSEAMFDGPMVKAVVDVKKGLLAIDAELHADLEQFLISNGSEQDNLWGINFYPEDDGEDLIEFDSMINVRPRQNNPSRWVDDPKIRQKIVEIVEKWIQ